MYSLVLLMSMTGAPETPNFGWHGGKHGCSSSCSGGYGYGGAPWGYSSYACSGCAGNVTSYHSCYGYAPNYYQPFSCFGYGIYGGTSYYFPTPIDMNPTSGYGHGYPIPANSIPRIEKVDESPKKIDVKPDAKPPEKGLMIYPSAPSSRAKVVVRLPADAKLFANNQLTTLASAERAFTTPPLQKNLDYQYEMKIEYARNGQTITDKQVVRVRAGEVSVLEFSDKTTSDKVASTLKFRAPEGTKLFIDGQPLTLTGSDLEFKTPDLVNGSEYAYTIRAELELDGKTQTQTQRVAFKAGEPVTVDFTELGAIRTASK